MKTICINLDNPNYQEEQALALACAEEVHYTVAREGEIFDREVIRKILEIPNCFHQSNFYHHCIGLDIHTEEGTIVMDYDREAYSFFNDPTDEDIVRFFEELAAEGPVILNNLTYEVKLTKAGRLVRCYNIWYTPIKSWVK